MSTRTEDLPTRLTNAAIAISFYEAKLDNAPTLDEIALEISHIAQELEDLYVPADTTGEIPTNAQGVALARFLRPQFRDGTDAGYRFARVCRGGAGLPDEYLLVEMADGYTGGIDREGRTST